MKAATRLLALVNRLNLWVQPCRMGTCHGAISSISSGAKLSGSGFVIYRAERAFATRADQFFHRLFNGKYLTRNWQYLFCGAFDTARGSTGQLPKFADQLYHAADDDLYLIPTAEVPVTIVHAVGKFSAPISYHCNTAVIRSCFRREAALRALVRVALHMENGTR